SYGYLWWLNGKASYIPPGITIPLPGYLTPDAPSDMYCAAGANGQFICVVPSLDLVMVRIGNESSNDPVPTIFLNEIWKRLSDVFCSSTAIEQLDATNIIVFPNPANDILQIESALIFDGAEIYDQVGRLVLRTKNCESIDVSNLSKGQYTIKLRSEKKEFTKIFLIEN
ncbi:MAG: T9SS type A sorting domain-containing protein, partial [Bacteroidia bacterium]|nr:T9SS type A sorting domain-containing protein [Bacteroidia bacterium]